MAVHCSSQQASTATRERSQNKGTQIEHPKDPGVAGMNALAGNNAARDNACIMCGMWNVTTVLHLTTPGWHVLLLRMACDDALSNSTQSRLHMHVDEIS
jgi:hypothetical protein